MIREFVSTVVTSLPFGGESRNRNVYIKDTTSQQHACMLAWNIQREGVREDNKQHRVQAKGEARRGEEEEWVP